MKLDGEICIITVGLSGTGMQLGMLAPVMTLAMHLVFGAVLGGVYGAERPELARGIQASHWQSPPERDAGVGIRTAEIVGRYGHVKVLVATRGRWRSDASKALASDILQKDRYRHGQIT